MELGEEAETIPLLDVSLSEKTEIPEIHGEKTMTETRQGKKLGGHVVPWRLTAVADVTLVVDLIGIVATIVVALTEIAEEAAVDSVEIVAVSAATATETEEVSRIVIVVALIVEVIVVSVAIVVEHHVIADLIEHVTLNVLHRVVPIAVETMVAVGVVDHPLLSKI